MKRFSFILIIVLLFASPCFAENYYCVKQSGTKTSGVSTTNISAFGWALADCYGTIQGAITRMAGGEQVVVDDGTYTGVNNAITGMPSGAADNYTVIQARNPFGATIDSGANSDPSWDYNKRLVYIAGSYVHVDGFKLLQRDSSNNYANLITGSYNKLTRCLCRIHGPMNGEMWGLGIGRASNILIEDCAFVGGFRYMVGIVGISSASSYIVFRRVVARGDWTTTGEPYSLFAVYGGNSTSDPISNNIYYQNCIAIDTNMIQGVNTYKHVPWYIFKRNHTIKLDGCITLNNQVPYYMFFRNDYGGYNLEIKNSVWAANTGSSTTASWRGSAVSSGYDRVHGCTFYGQPRAFSWNGATTQGYIKNNLFVSLSNSSITFTGSSPSSKIYNSFGTSGQSFGSNTVAYQNDLLYLPQVESSSNRATGGDGGAKVGAHILKRIGASGTLYGESGWDQTTEESLWPWPYEAQIRDWFRTANNPPAGASPSTNDTTRGFCAADETLTHYIWNYLGNGGFEDPTPPPGPPPARVIMMR